MRGRPRLPDEVKKLKGTYKKSRANPEALKLTELLDVPEPPDFFEDDIVATNVWNTVCEELVKQNILQSLDIFLLQMLCQEMSLYWKCQTSLMSEGLTIDTGTGSKKVNPTLTISNQALANVNRIASKFGLTPSDRQRLKMSVAAAKPKSNPALELIYRKKSLTAGEK